MRAAPLAALLLLLAVPSRAARSQKGAKAASTASAAPQAATAVKAASAGAAAPAAAVAAPAAADNAALAAIPAAGAPAQVGAAAAQGGDVSGALEKAYEKSAGSGAADAPISVEEPPAAARPAPKRAAQAATAEKTPEQLMFEDPVREYSKYRARLKKDGPNASFPEFKPAVEEVLNELRSDNVKATVARHPDLEYELKEVLTQFFHVNLDFTFDDKDNYPYDRPFPGPFPYRPTIDAIESGLRFLDKIERLTNPNTVPLYHFNRYAYHRHSLLADPDVVIFPTVKSLGFESLVRVRSVPLGLVGVVTKTVRVDRHFQSPLDFWYHDLNHVRRMAAYIALRAKKKGLKSYKQKLKFYQDMDDFTTKTIMPAIKKLGEGATEEQRWVRALMRVIVFEIVHETALTIERESILNDIRRKPDTPQPFEHMILEQGFDPSRLETQLRTDTGNLRSGADQKLGESMAEATKIRYFHDRALSLLANVYNKLLAGFYDDVADPKNYVAPAAARKADYLVKAAQELQALLGDPDPLDAATLRALVLSKKGSPEKFTYKMLSAHEADVEKLPQATEPLSGEEAARRIRAHADKAGKKVYTLFGYSKLDYHNRREAMARLRKELQTLDPKKWIVLIGATDEGIGSVYPMAKELGFETMGLVSTQGMTYAGKFSKHVDSIFIVEDQRWGGDGSPTTAAFVAASDVISAHGGGENTAAALRLAAAKGTSWRFTPAQMNHVAAAKDAKERGLPPYDLDGAAAKAARALEAARPR